MLRKIQLALEDLCETREYIAEGEKVKSLEEKE